MKAVFHNKNIMKIVFNQKFCFFKLKIQLEFTEFEFINQIIKLLHHDQAHQQIKIDQQYKIYKVE